MTTKSKVIRREYDVESVVNAAAERVAAKKLVTGNRVEISSSGTVEVGGKTLNLSDYLGTDKNPNPSYKYLKIEGSTDLESIIGERNSILNRIRNFFGIKIERNDTASIYKRAYLRSKQRTTK